jgi:hypothetical protein
VTDEPLLPNRLIIPAVQVPEQGRPEPPPVDAMVNVEPEGVMVMLLPAVRVYHEGAAVEPEKLPKIASLVCVESVKLSAGVEVAVATEVVKSGERFPELKEVTVPAPEGVAHVPSPLQNVVEEAPVPPLRFVTGRLPVTSPLARFTALDVTVWVDPAKWAMPTPGEEATTQVAHAMVPVEVMVPPVMGLVVAIEVTVPPPPPPVEFKVVPLMLSPVPRVICTGGEPEPVEPYPISTELLVPFARAERGICPAVTAREGVVVELLTEGTSHVGHEADGAAKEVTVPAAPETVRTPLVQVVPEPHSKTPNPEDEP